jgi:hypothetical protein
MILWRVLFLYVLLLEPHGVSCEVRTASLDVIEILQLLSGRSPPSMQASSYQMQQISLQMFSSLRVLHIPNIPLHITLTS